MRNDPAVLATTRSESGVASSEVLLFQSALVVLALFLGGGPSSPSVPSSYPEVFPPKAAAVLGFRPALGLLTEVLEDGRDADFFTLPPAVRLLWLSFPDISALTGLKAFVMDCC